MKIPISQLETNEKLDYRLMENENWYINFELHLLILKE
jgi:hypothetical protein